MRILLSLLTLLRDTIAFLLPSTWVQISQRRYIWNEKQFAITKMLDFYTEILSCLFYFSLERQRKGIPQCLSKWLTEMKHERKQLCLWAKEVKTRQDVDHIFLTTQYISFTHFPNLHVLVRREWHQILVRNEFLFVKAKTYKTMKHVFNKIALFLESHRNLVFGDMLFL